ncbi:fimbrial protein [Enterobacter mori]|uniref:fimbrial protein n=1 Tax=Enterobacter mori TaxID=539813 RepID=UPI001B8DA240|nr:fimbrial protein [Enterobacter mori]MBS3045957.1 fimbrial protein [Enterobacter mori]
MKKVLALATLSIACAISTTSVFASDGTVNFTGEIIDSACTIDIGANNTMTVDMGKVAKKAFTGKDSTASATKFVLKMTDCPTTVTSASVKFDGTGYAGDDSVLALTADTGVATGVAVELTDSAQKVLPLFTASTSVTLAEGDNEMPFYARYKQMAADVTPGPANATAQFTVNYN